MRERRRSPRFDLVLPVVVNTAHGVFKTKTVNASLLGVVVFADQPPTLGAYAELEIALPDGRVVSATAVVTRGVKELQDGAGTKGRAVAFDFYLFDARGKEAWSALIEKLGRSSSLKQLTAEESTDQSIRIAPTGAEPAAAGRRSREPLASKPALVPSTPLKPSISESDDLPTFLIKPRDVERLRGFMRSELSAGRVRIETPVLKPVGTRVELVVVHPSTNAEWSMPGEVTLASETGRGRGPMLEIAVLGLTEEEHNRFRGFVQHGRSSMHDPDGNAPVRIPMSTPALAKTAPPPPLGAVGPMVLKASVPAASVPPPQLPMVSPVILAPPPIAKKPASGPPDALFMSHETQLPTEVVHAYQPEALTPREEVSSSDALAFAEPERATEPPVPLPPATPVLPEVQAAFAKAEAEDGPPRFDSAAETVLPAERASAVENGPEITDSERARRRERVRSKPFASFFHEFLPGSLPPDSTSVTAQAATQVAEESTESFEEVEETRRDFRSESSAREYAPIVMDQDIEAAREKVDRTPESATAVFQLGRLLYRKGDPAGALDVLVKAVELEPNHPGAHHAAAQALVELGRYDTAAEHLRKARLLGYQIDSQLEREINQRR